MERLLVALALLAAAPVAWIAGSLLLGTRQYVLPLVLVGIGIGLAAWAVPRRRRIPAGIALGIAALGIALFYGFDFWSALPQRAGGVVLLGLVVGALALAADAPRGLAAGLAVVAVGSLLWVRADWGVWEWQVGNLLAVAGAGWAAFEIWRQDTAH